MTIQNDTELRQHLNQETGKLAWSELEKHFARGSVVKVDPTLDLVDVAVKFVQDDKTAVEAWVSKASVTRASEDDARRWQSNDATFWAVVTAPWVLVQECVEN